MKMHERCAVVREARSDLTVFLNDWMSRHHELTFGEELSIVQGVLGGHVGDMAKYEIRKERHGDDQTPGGLA